MHYKYCMAQWFVTVHRSSEDPFNYPNLGKVQYFKIELIYHNFSIVEHPDYPGLHRARFIAMHECDSRITYVAMKYHDCIPFSYDKMNSFV